jgi:SLT domain-containing protein
MDGKVTSPDSAGAYSNYYKAEAEAKANPAAYYQTTNAVSKALTDLGFPQEWLKPTLELVARESSFNPDAKNAKSTASGLFQFLDGTRKDYGWSGVDWSDPTHQSKAGLKYIKDRYGTPEKALQFWDKNKWF